MKFIVPVVAALSALALGTSCQSPRQVRTQQARTMESSRIQEEQLARMNQSLREYQEQYSANMQQISALQGQIATLDRKVQALGGEVENLKQQLALERQSRQAEMDRLLQQVAKETAEAIRSSTPPSTGGRNLPATPGEFYEYTVESGATLSAIAKAYGVTVDDIRKANRMSNDNIRVGQKLFVPKR